MLGRFRVRIRVSGRAMTVPVVSVRARDTFLFLRL